MPAQKLPSSRYEPIAKPSSFFTIIIIPYLFGNPNKKPSACGTVFTFR